MNIVHNNFSQKLFFMFVFFSLVQFISGCSGVQTYPGVARAGDTVSIAAGWKQNFSRNNITVTITPSSGSAIVYGPGNPAVRAVIDLYPDPVSSLIVSTETGQDLTPYATTYANLINLNVTNADKDWWQTTVFLDLPNTLPTGITTIDISSSNGEMVSSTINIVGGAGTPELFYANGNGPLNQYQLESMERVQNYQISFDAPSIPYAIQAEFSHFPDLNNGGTGKAYVINPRGDLKNVTWSDDGTNLKVMIVPSQAKYLSAITDFKFYVAGGITGLILTSVQAVDSAGNPVTGVTASIVSKN